MMESDGQIRIVVAPQRMEQHLRLRARVDEDERHAVRLDRLDRSREARSAPNAGQGAAWKSRMVMSAFRCLASLRSDLPATAGARLALSVSDKEGSKLRQPCHRRRQADCLKAGRQRAQPRNVSARRSPRLVEASACNSSMMTMRSEPNRLEASRCDSVNAICSGVVSRMSGGFSRWRWRREAGVSPVRVSSVIGSPISAGRSARLRAISTASALSGET